jgi:AcrR family transcriptional regulator
MVTTRKGAATRRRILDAAWDLSDERGVDTVLAGVTLREVAAASGMTPSSVSYHFPTMHDLAVAMVEHLIASTSLQPDTTTEVVGDELAGRADEGLATALRAALRADWDVLTSPTATTLQHRVNRAEAGASDPAIRDGVAAINRTWVEQLTELYEATAAEFELRPVEPLTLPDLARAIFAMIDGLQRQWMVDPDAVRPDLSSDIAVLLISAAVVPAGRPTDLEEITVQLPRPVVADLGRSAATDAAARVAHLFASGMHDVTLTRVGQELGWGAEHVARHFGSVRALAAMAFHRHLTVVEEAVQRRPSAGARTCLTDGVYELARAALADPHCALALAHERQETRLRPLPERPGEDIRALVPVGEVLAGPLEAAGDRRRSECIELGDLVADTVLTHAATHPRRTISDVTGLALRLVPEDSDICAGNRPLV